MSGIASFSGLASGIDGSRLARALFDQLTLVNKPREQSIDFLASERGSLDTLRTLLLDVKDKLDGLRTASGGAQAKAASSSDQAIVQASAGSSAQKGTFAVTVEAMATNAVLSFDRSFGSGEDLLISSLAESGTTTVTVGSGNDAVAVQVAVGPTTTARSFVDSFNASAAGAANAQLVNIGTDTAPDYRITILSAKTGAEAGSVALAFGSTELEAAFGTASVSQAQNARFTIQGIAGTFERATNTVNDAVQGVSISLRGVGSATVSVNDNPSQATSQLAAFIGSFNSLVSFVAKEDRITVTQKDGANVNVYGTLSKTGIDDAAVSTLREAIGAISQLGVSTQRDGTLAFDEKVFADFYSKNPGDAAAAITAIADRLAGVEGAINQFTAYGRAIDQALSRNSAETDLTAGAISRTEQSASQREAAALKQFTELERVMAKLNADSGFLSSLLTF